MKNMIKKIFIVFIIAFLTFSIIEPPKTYADTEKKTVKQMIDEADDFIEQGEKESSKRSMMTKENLQDISTTTYNTLFLIAVVIAVGYGVYIGIHLIMGGIEEKAKVKETLIPYIAGCIVIFGAFTIWKLVVTILQSSETN